MAPRSNGSRRSAAQVEADFLRVLAELRMVFQRDDLPQKLVLSMLGYAHPQSTGFLKAKAKFRKSNLITVSSGSIQLTAEGILALPQDVKPPTSNDGFQRRFRELLHDKVKPTGKFDLIFNRLLDGKTHAKKDLLSAAGYNHPQSTGFLKSMKALKDFELLDTRVGAGNVRLNDLVFPLGRPGQENPPEPVPPSLPPAEPVGLSVPTEPVPLMVSVPTSSLLSGCASVISSFSAPIPGPHPAVQEKEVPPLSGSTDDHITYTPPACFTTLLVDAKNTPSAESLPREDTACYPKFLTNAPHSSSAAPVSTQMKQATVISSSTCGFGVQYSIPGSSVAKATTPASLGKSVATASLKVGPGPVQKKKSSSNRTQRAALAMGFSFGPRSLSSTPSKKGSTSRT